MIKLFLHKQLNLEAAFSNYKETFGLKEKNNSSMLRTNIKCQRKKLLVKAQVYKTSKVKTLLKYVFRYITLPLRNTYHQLIAA